MSGLSAEDHARGAVARTRAAILDNVYKMQPADRRFAKVITDCDIYQLEGFQANTCVLLEDRTANPSSGQRIPEHQLLPDQYMYKISRYICDYKYHTHLSPESGSFVITSSSLSVDNPLRNPNAVAVPPGIQENSRVYLLKDVRWRAGPLWIDVKRGTPCQIYSRVSRVGINQGLRTSSKFMVKFWKKVYHLRLVPYSLYVPWTSLGPLSQGELPYIPIVPPEEWATEFPDLRLVQ
ncbi:hypothetical protein A0H81_02477 [Grifola frondosa]|uniref:Uncharacterized protein n=1 Tax=Grifola frondosa TaxID=5627 RepID=A0A1C7MRS9_GRIFR|nr:hypothetical protein A0H81_02477 [Grifola frondosa]